MFPRTALILRELQPAARLVIVDCDARNLETARSFLQPRGFLQPGVFYQGDVEYRNARFMPGESSKSDLTVIPLCFEGDRSAIYRTPPSPFVLVHDWIWRRRGVSSVVSVVLLKRVNLVQK